MTRPRSKNIPEPPVDLIREQLGPNSDVPTVINALGSIGLTDSQLGNIAGAKRGSVADWRHGRRHPNDEAHIRLHLARGVVSELIDRNLSPRTAGRWLVSRMVYVDRMPTKAADIIRDTPAYAEALITPYLPNPKAN